MSAGKPRRMCIPCSRLWPTHNSTHNPTPPYLCIVRAPTNASPALLRGPALAASHLTGPAFRKHPSAGSA